MNRLEQGNDGSAGTMTDPSCDSLRRTSTEPPGTNKPLRDRNDPSIFWNRELKIRIQNLALKSDTSPSFPSSQRSIARVDQKVSCAERSDGTVPRPRT
ncbi:MAG: hypothetical protein A2428_05160 [Bdellovibrionales bacterium RIFOXYC1_FULL_54_43]|nr:MAG: hypothetical protein A2428_05160 [Bdellovibrionales bacterium RIFOXYC1_FULL_54_43]